MGLLLGYVCNTTGCLVIAIQSIPYGHHSSVSNAYHVGMNQTSALGHIFTSRLCHSGQTHRFRYCSVPAIGALEYPKTNSRNSNK